MTHPPAPESNMRSPRKNPCGVRWRSVGYVPPNWNSQYEGLRYEKLDPWRTGNWSQGEKYGLQFYVMGCKLPGFEYAVRRRARTLYTSIILIFWMTKRKWFKTPLP